MTPAAAAEARVAAFRALLADRGLPADDVPEESLVELLGALDAICAGETTANPAWSPSALASVIGEMAPHRSGQISAYLTIQESPKVIYLDLFRNGDGILQVILGWPWAFPLRRRKGTDIYPSIVALPGL